MDTTICPVNVTLRSCLRAETPVVYPRKKVYINESVNTYDDPDRDLHAAAVDAARKGEHGFFFGSARRRAAGGYEIGCVAGCDHGKYAQNCRGACGALRELESRSGIPQNRLLKSG